MNMINQKRSFKIMEILVEKIMRNLNNNGFFFVLINNFWYNKIYKNISVSPFYLPIAI